MVISRFFDKIKYEALLFGFMSFSLAIVLSNEQDPMWLYNEFYLVDYSVGFCSRLLIASIVSLITDNFSNEWLTGFCIASNLIAYLLYAILAGRVIRKLKDNTATLAKAAAFTVALFPLGMTVFAHWFGMLDIFMFIIAMITVVCINSKWLCVLTPVLIFIGLAVHPGYVFQYAPLIGALLAYKMVKSNFAKSDVILFFVSAAVGALSLAYFEFFALKTLTVSFEGLKEHIASKIGDYSLIRGEFYKGYLFNDYSDEVIQGSDTALANPSNYYERIMVFLSTAFGSISVFTLIYYFICFVFVCVFFCVLLRRLFKTEKGFLRKSPYVLSALIIFMSACASLLSTDTQRWLSAGILSMLIFMLNLLYNSDETATAVCDKAGEKLKSSPLIAVLFLFAFVSSLY